MRLFLLCVMIVLLPLSSVWAQTEKTCPCHIQWDLNLEADMSHYNLFYGSTSGIYDHPDSPFRVDHPAIEAQNVEVTLALANGTYFLVMTAVNTAGAESIHTETELTLHVQNAPAPPTGLRHAGVLVP